MNRQSPEIGFEANNHHYDRKKSDEFAEYKALKFAEAGGWEAHAHQDFEAAAQEIAVDAVIGLAEMNSVPAHVGTAAKIEGVT